MFYEESTQFQTFPASGQVFLIGFISVVAFGFLCFTVKEFKDEKFVKIGFYPLIALSFLMSMLCILRMTYAAVALILHTMGIDCLEFNLDFNIC